MHTVWKPEAPQNSQNKWRWVDKIEPIAKQFKIGQKLIRMTLLNLYNNNMMSIMVLFAEIISEDCQKTKLLYRFLELSHELSTMNSKLTKLFIIFPGS